MAEYTVAALAQAIRDVTGACDADYLLRLIVRYKHVLRVEPDNTAPPTLETAIVGDGPARYWLARAAEEAASQARVLLERM